MLALRVEWYGSNVAMGSSYSMYEADKYFVNPDQDGITINVVVDDDRRQFKIGEWDRMFVMNAIGKTIDTVRGSGYNSQPRSSWPLGLADL